MKVNKKYGNVRYDVLLHDTSVTSIAGRGTKWESEHKSVFGHNVVPTQHQIFFFGFKKVVWQ